MTDRRDTHLCLQKVSGDNLAPVTVEESKRGAERRGGDTPEGSLGVDTPPAGLGFVNGFVEEVVEEEGLEAGILDVGGGDVTEEDRLDDATTTPHPGNTGVVEVPVEL